MKHITAKEALAKFNNPPGVRTLEVQNHGFLVYNSLQKKKEIVGFVAYAGVCYPIPLLFEEIALAWFRFAQDYQGKLEAKYFPEEGVWKVRPVKEEQYIASVSPTGEINMFSLV